ncbi:radical SAM/SPASM domain-containing protein [Haliangium ochraceum]|uniref:Radical SAM domain protein n=1 Tax=Haliangium ochraceum (strain DSM 14365 / JCM 11303 / SMP-2) TaxID=502025 RepID=D0LM66_HALO1|nr:radical SAM protein [Haliangium ochraceum]ACY16772.1 Radical SAM domain protein [Haliangium ochraceum DSM 14365]
MQLSAFNLYAPGVPDEDDVLVHNSFTGAFVVLERALLEALEHADPHAPLAPALRQRVEDAELSDPDIGVLVADGDDEARAYRRWFEAQRSERAMHSIVAVNRACNFACTYCCQAQVMDGAVMKPETARQSARWLAERARQIGADSLHLSFVGGEPLLHPARIETIMSALADELADELPVRMSLITNGALLDEDMLTRLLAHGLCSAQITLDGDAHSHGRTRVSKRGEATFERIFDNLMRASRRIHISLNGNYQPDTIDGFGPLVRALAEADFGRAHSIAFSPALATLDAPAGSGSGACTWSQSQHGYRVALYDTLVAHGYHPHRLSSVGPCAFHKHHMYVVDVDGTLLKCPGFLAHPEWGIGHVERGLDGRYQRLLALDLDATCDGCAHRPNCSGGCVANALLAGGTPDTPYDPALAEHHCEIEYFQAMSPHALPREYLMVARADPLAALAEFPPPPLPLPERAGQRSPALRVL